MPWRDGTGPAGAGPMTGRGFGRGMRRGFGFRQFYPVPAQTPQAMPQMTKEEEIADLKAEKDAIEKRLKELEKKNKK